MLFSLCRYAKTPARKRQSASLTISVEVLEDRLVPSTFTVLNLNDHGDGSLRQAIASANAHPGADVIDFCVAGTIQLTTGALPAITGKVNIDGDSAPDFAGTPLVEIDYNDFGGLVFDAGAAGSTLQGLSLVDAAGAGVTLNGGGSMLIAGNYIGLTPDGSTVVGNRGDGIDLIASSSNTIGGSTAQARNVISGNGGNGIDLNHASHNVIDGNFIGTYATGALNRGNACNGILLTNGAASNTIGGQATGGNSPTDGVYVRPPQGNLISGNDANGVLINDGATQNSLSGNFIGTTLSGDYPLGNALDGVWIQNANSNSLLGCALTTNPFVFYNVISGNGANGLQITSSNDTIVQGNFFGLGANNQTPVGNHLNGVVVEGTSTGTVMGGPIPLGNVDAANGQNGIVVQGTASFFTSYNTFCGLAAFQTYTNLGNGNDGMLITSTGGNILIRTNVITENGNDGIEVAGEASGVRIAGNLVGVDTQGNAAMGNKNNGIEVDGDAHDILIGGPQATFNIIPHNAISANGGNGVAIDGAASNIQIDFSDIGTDLVGTAALGNALAGICVGPGTSAITIGSRSPNLPTIISGNLGNGISLNGVTGDTVAGCLIGTNALGVGALGNGGAGILITNGHNNVIGGTAVGSGNFIAFNATDGVHVASGTGNGILANSIYANTGLGIDLAAGANNNQPAPTLTSVSLMLNLVHVTGTVSGAANTILTIELFANTTSGPSGRIFLGTVTVKTNGAGVATFSFTGLRPTHLAFFVTATATGPNDNTSEFSAAMSTAP